MADNIAVTAGSGTSVATDDIGGVHYQRVKLALGADGAGVDAVAGAGAVSTAVQRVTLASDDPVTTAVQIMDDWDETNRCAVNPISGQVGIAGGAGTAGATVVRTVTATDSGDVVSLAIMDDWDESDRAKVNIIAGQVGVAAGAGAVGSTVQRVTLASDDVLVAKIPSALTAGGAFKVAQVDESGNEFDYTLPAEVDQYLNTTTGLTLTHATISSATTTEVISATSGQTSRIHRMSLSCNGSNTITIKRGSTSLRIYYPNAAGWTLELRHDGMPWFVTAANEAFNITTASANTVAYTVEYIKSA